MLGLPISKHVSEGCQVMYHLLDMRLSDSVVWDVQRREGAKLNALAAQAEVQQNPKVKTHSIKFTVVCVCTYARNPHVCRADLVAVKGLQGVRCSTNHDRKRCESSSYDIDGAINVSREGSGVICLNVTCSAELSCSAHQSV